MRLDSSPSAADSLIEDSPGPRYVSRNRYHHDPHRSTSTSLRPSSPRAVRFCLPQTPPEQTDIPLKYKEVGTKDVAPEVFKLKDLASKWRKRDLDLLGVNYQYDRFDEISIPVDGMPSELLERIILFQRRCFVVIETTSANIRNVDMNIVRRCGAISETLEMLTRLGLQLFGLAYSSLGTLLAHIRDSTGMAPVMFATPLGQTTVPPNPNFSGASTESGSSGSSGSSADSKREPYVTDFATRFLEATFLTFSPWMRSQWTTPNADFFFFSEYNPLAFSDLV